MKLSLSSATQQRIGAILESGRYAAADELVRAGLAALEQREQFASSELEELLAEGERSIKKKGTVTATEVFAKLRSRGAARSKSTSRRGKIA